jgi:glycine/D-amino acid oxidase-like deaminating enzyme
VGVRNIAVIGAGIAGLLAAHGLRRAGYEVTLFSDRTPEQWLAGRPTGTAARFSQALAYERELELDHWAAEAPEFVGAHLIYSPRPGLRLATLTGRQSTAHPRRPARKAWSGDRRAPAEPPLDA